MARLNSPPQLALRWRQSIDDHVIALAWSPDGSTVAAASVTGPVTSFQHSFIVSDQGTAAIWGHDASEQAEQIIAQVAHPRVRDELREAGRALGFRV